MTLHDHRLPLLLLFTVALGTGGMCPLPPDAVYGRPCGADADCGDLRRCGPAGTCGPPAVALDGGDRPDAGALEDAGDAGVLEDAGEPEDDGGAEDAGAPTDGGPPLSEVEPRYAGFSSWHDYVKSDELAQSCSGVEPGRYGLACRHAGPARRARLPLLSDCGGVVAHDALEALSWECRERDGQVSVISTDLAPGKRLLDLIDPVGLAFRLNHLVVETPAGVLETEPARWWSDPLVAVTGSQSLSEPGTIYVLAGVVSAVSLDAPSIALVMPPGTRVAGSGEIVVASGGRFLWIEGEVRGAEGLAIAAPPVRLDDTRWSVVRGLRARTATLGAAVHVTGGNALLLRDVQAEGGAGLRVESASAHTLQRVDVADASVGLSLYDVTGLLIDDGVITNVGGGGAAGDAILLQQASGNVLSRLLLVGSRDDALSMVASQQNVFRYITAILNEAAGVSLDAASDGNYFEGLALVNNSIGVTLTDSFGNHFGDVAALHNGIGVQLNTAQSQTIFFGDLRVGENGTACSGTGTPDIAGGPFTSSGCTAATGQPFTLVAGLNAEGSFVGHVPADAVNPTPSATPGYNDIVDWTRFENRTRTYVPSDGILSSGSRGRCRPGEDTCHLTDFGLVTPISGEGALFDVLPSPLTAVSTWAEAPGGTSVVRHLLELEGDGDSLCEDGERCLAMPHIGAYAGHGELVEEGVVVLDGGDELSVERYAVPGY